jgi:lambda family phage portal protein
MRRKPVSLSTVFQDLRNDFRAGKDTRFTSRLAGVSSSGSGADYHYRSESQFLHMMERARNYQRNDPIVGQGVRRLVANIVQDGFTLDVNTGNEDLDNDLKGRWDEWACTADLCHSEGEFTFSQMEQLALSSVVVDGDVFALPLTSGSLQMVEAHRCRTPKSTTRNVVHGVLMDDAARRQEYWFTKEDLDPNRQLVKVSDVKPYPARSPNGERNVLHIYQPYRFSQRRGVTALAPVSDTVGMHDDIQFATLVKAQMAALIAILHNRGANWQPGGDQQKGDRETETLSGGHTRTIEGVSAGLEIFSDIDEKLEAFSPNIPSPEFFPHAMMVLTFIAINLDLPVHVLLLDPSKTNFSGWRGAIDQARLRFKQIQKWYAECFHTPIYRWKVRQWAQRDPALRSQLDSTEVQLFGHRWNPPAFAYLEPLTDASADLLQQRNALNSSRRIHAARGREWKVVAQEIVADNGMAIEMALTKAAEINAKFPDAEVHWRELISLPTPDGVTVQIGQPEQQQPEPKNKDE